MANADRLTKIPINNPKEKKPNSFIKNAIKYSRSEKTMDISLKSEYNNPKIKEMIKTKTVEIRANDINM